MSAVLEMFAVTAGTTAPKPPRDVEAERDRAWHILANKLLAMHWAAVEIERAERKAARIAARLDDPALTGTDAQRAEAEATRRRILQNAAEPRDTIRAAGRSVHRLFEDIRADDRTWLITVLAPGWADSPLWRLVEGEPELMTRATWQRLTRAARQAMPGDPPPF